MPTLDATVGGASSNSFATVSEADDYFDERLNTSDWDDASTDDKERALIMATRRIDRETFEGTRVDPDPEDQQLAWPRTGVVDQDGRVFDNDVIPDAIKHATFELALVIIGDEDFLADSGLEAFDQVSVGDLSVTPRHQQRAGELPEAVTRYLDPFTFGSRHNVRVRRA